MFEAPKVPCGIFGSKRVIFVQKNFFVQANGGGGIAKCPPPKYTTDSISELCRPRQSRDKVALRWATGCKTEQDASLTERDNRITHYNFALFCLGYFLVYLATSDAKSDVIFLLGDPDFQ